MTEISLTASMRTNLQSLSLISRQMDKTQERLSTGLKVNSAIDNASSYYHARSLTNRAADLAALLDSMGQGIQTIQAANEGIEHGLAFLEQMKSVVEQAMSQGVSGVTDVGSLSKPSAILGTDVRPLYNGRENTQAIIDQIGGAGLAATAANQFYVTEVGADHEYFGQGKWYLPAIGELIDMYGINTEAMTGGYGTSGATKEKSLALINASLAELKAAGADAEEMSGYYWSASEYDSSGYSWLLNMNYGFRSYFDKNYDDNVRVFQHLENCFYPFNSSEAASGSEGTGGLSAPKIGDVMYDDLSYGKASEYDAASGKTAVGVIAWISEDGRDAKIVNLKDLKFNNRDTEGNFDAEHPYEGSTSYTYWATNEKYSEDITGIDNYNSSALLDEIKKNTPYQSSGGAATATYVDEAPGEATDGNIDASYQKQFNTVLNEYDKLIRDASYQGVNLLTSGKLNLTFNETRSHKFEVAGRDVSSAGLGLEEAEWKTLADVEAAQNDIQKAIRALRDFSTELGNNYQIIQTRQNFTDMLIDVLETGADDLVLADMNEESANYLALQTRQQLAINSLSLAASSAQSILRLF